MAVPLFELEVFGTGIMFSNHCTTRVYYIPIAGLVLIMQRSVITCEGNWDGTENLTVNKAKSPTSPCVTPA
jgi:hypothetical protein